MLLIAWSITPFHPIPIEQKYGKVPNSSPGYKSLQIALTQAIIQDKATIRDEVTNILLSIEMVLKIII